MRRAPTKRWWKAYGALHGEQLTLVDKKDREEAGLHKAVEKKSSLACPLEVEEQIKAATWLAKNNIPFFHIPNGGYRDHREAAKFKRMGVQSGIPDLCIPVARSPYHGAYIELKRISGGRLSESQGLWRDILIKEGYYWAEAKGSQECIRIVSDYLKIT